MCEYTAKDYKKGQPRWCPGCGDHFFLASSAKLLGRMPSSQVSAAPAVCPIT